MTNTSGRRNESGDIPSTEYFSSESFNVAVGKRSLAEALDVVFSPGEPLLLWHAVPNGLIEAIVKRYLASCEGLLTMRSVVIVGLNITDVWFSAYYTSFPCYECSSTDCRNAEQATQCLVFHLTPRGGSQKTLSLKHTYRMKSEIRRLKVHRVDVVVGTTQCSGLGEKSRAKKRRLAEQKTLLRLAELRAEIFHFLPRSGLETCLLVGRQWKAEIERLSEELALRELTSVRISRNPEKGTVKFFVSTGKCELGSIRCFTFPRDVYVDCAIVVNHLRNCAAETETNSFAIDFPICNCNDVEDSSFAPWTVAMLGSVKNFRCEGISLYLEYLGYSSALNFLSSTHVALESCTRKWGISDLWLQIFYPALDALVDERFVEWEFIQRLRYIRVEVFLFGPAGDPDWIRSLFLLPHCSAFDLAYCIQDNAQDDVDWSAHAFDIMGEVMRDYENASDVSGFVRNFEFILRLPVLTWDHDEPVSTHSNVTDERLGGRFNVYVTKNNATGVPLSVLVDTKENIELDAFGDEERHLLLRKERYEVPSDVDC